ncbi:MAG: DUF3794 domain-containing protein [Faecousia sp.]
MDLQFPKTRCTWLSSPGGERKDLEETLELKLPENMPDIGKVLCGYGQALVRSKQWSREGAAISGGVMAWVLYLPEDGSGVRSVECWIPFQARWDIPDRDRDGVILAGCYLRNLDARSLSARKLMVRADLVMVANTMVENTVDISYPEELPEDVQVRRQKYDVELPVEAGEKIVDIEENIPAPAGEHPEKLLHYSLHPFVTDCKLMADRVVFRGTALGHTLYRGEDGELHGWDFQVPFSQYSELDKEYGPDARLQVTMVPTGLELELREDGGLNLKAGLIGQYLVFDRKALEVVTDAYSTQRALEMQTQSVELPQVTSLLSERRQAGTQGGAAMGKVLDCVFFGDGPRMRLSSQDGSAELSGRWQVLGTDEEGTLCSESLSWQDTMPLNPAEQGSLTLWQAGRPEATPGAALSAQVDLGMEGLLQEKITVPMVTGVSLGEPLERPADRPSLILRRAGKGSLWDLAKANATTQEKIMSANSLTQEPEEGSWLLIPIP